MSDDDVTARFDDARRRVEATRAGVLAGDPWPLSARFDHTPEASWGPPEILAHLVEMVPFWERELDRVARAAPDAPPTPFGRIATDADRLAEIERLRTMPPVELYRLLDDALASIADRWADWPPAARASIGLHPTRGELSVEAGVERFILSHVGEHIDQLEAIVAEDDGD